MISIKKAIITLLIIVSFERVWADRNNLEKDSIIRIEIQKLEMIVETEINVSCENYNDQFSGDIKAEVIKDKSTISTLTKLLQKRTLTDNTNIDVREKIIIYYRSGKKNIICLGERSTLIFLDGSFYLLNSLEIFDFLDKISVH